MTREEVAEVSKAMADPNRVKIIQMLSLGEMCGCNLLSELNVTQPTLSHHMKILVDSGLVNSRKEGKWTHYRINCSKFKAFKAYISSITCSGDQCCCLDDRREKKDDEH